MLFNSTFAIIGGDMRQTYLSKFLAADGYEVLTYGLERGLELTPGVRQCRILREAVETAGCIVLPLPFSNNNGTVNAPYSKVEIPLEEIWGAAKPDQMILGGKFSNEAIKKAGEYGVKLIDYYLREELEVLNTIATAEGAIQIAMEETAITLHGAKCLVLGFGRVAKTLCKDLKGLGADITASAREYSALAWMKTYGYNGFHISRLAQEAGEFDIVFNTIPALILNETVLKKLKEDCLVIDLASKPGGVDFGTAGQLGVKAIWALSLPGKVAPITSGAIIKDTIVNIVIEEGSK
jgi:dipicolinate synthase subunit A